MKTRRNPCRRVVDAVADEGDFPAVGLQAFDFLCLLAGQHLGHDTVDAGLAGNSAGGVTVVAGQHGHCQTEGPQRIHGPAAARFQRIADPGHRRQFAVGTFSNRDYYGTVNHNAKAVYQRYFGWYDGNPANLHALPPENAAPRYVEFMGGADALLEKARASYEQGEYRWVAMVLNHLVFSQPENEAARELLAATYDQLGYRAESAPWRDFYLTGANELRGGVGEVPFASAAPRDIVSMLPTGLFFDALAVRLNGPKADGEDTALNFVFTDIGEVHVIEIENAVLHHRQTTARDDADATITLTRAAWNQILVDRSALPGKLLSGEIDVDGSRLEVIGFFAMLDDFEPTFPIVTP